MNQLSLQKKVELLRYFVNGTGIRSAAEFANVSKTTVQKFLQDLGKGCIEYLDKNLMNIKGISTFFPRAIITLNCSF